MDDPVKPNDDPLEDFSVGPPEIHRDLTKYNHPLQSTSKLEKYEDAPSELENQGESKHGARRVPETMFSPNACLLYALEETGNVHAIPPKDGRRANPMSFQEPSLQAILAKQILVMADSKETSGFQVLAFDIGESLLDAEDRAYLHSQGYNTDDLIEWASLLIAKDIYVPAMVLYGPQQKEESWPPIFLFLFVLRRQTIHARTLQVLLSHAWALLQSRTAYLTAVDRSTVFTIFNRLLQHTRKVWPEAIVNIARIISTYLRLPHSDEQETGPQDTKHHAAISRQYNRTLSLLANQ